MIARIILSIAYVLSAVLLPWWLTVFLGVVLLAYLQSYVVVIIGALVLDTMHGAGIVQLFGVSFLYTGLFLFLIICERILRTQLLD